MKFEDFIAWIKFCLDPRPDKLYTKPIPETEKRLPSPTDLKGYIIVKVIGKGYILVEVPVNEYIYLICPV